MAVDDGKGGHLSATFDTVDHHRLQRRLRTDQGRIYIWASLGCSQGAPKLHGSSSSN